MLWWRRKDERTKIDPPVDPDTDPFIMLAAAQRELLEHQRETLRAGDPARKATRELARSLRQQSEDLVEKNHFGQSIAASMKPRRA